MERTTVKQAMRKISEMKTKEEILKYCGELDNKGEFGYSDGSQCAYWNGFDTLAARLTHDEDAEKLPDSDNYLLMFRNDEDEDNDGYGPIPNVYFFGIDFEAKTITKFTYSRWSEDHWDYDDDDDDDNQTEADFYEGETLNLSI